ncbi:MAG: hypothetical protein IJA16_04280, partial [Clostridia bacterium]|nr:hypothetical protein [Clostridia bacterium]
SSFEAYESPYSKSPGSAAVYDWAKEHHERMQRLGVPTTSSPNAYQNGDTFKIIKDGGATEKDYSDFFEGFESIYESEPAKPQTTARNQSRDAYDSRVRKEYAVRQQAENDAKYSDYDIDAARARLYDSGYWLEKVYASREAGKGFAGDQQVRKERDALATEISRAQAAQERNKTRRYDIIPYAEDFRDYAGYGGEKIYIAELEHPEYLRYATADELGTYTYLRYKEGEQSASEYLNYLEPILTARKGEDEGKTVAAAGAMLYIPYRAMAGLEGYGRNIEQLLSDEAVPYTSMAYANSYLSENAEGVEKFAGDLAYGIGNTAPSVAASMLHPLLGKASFAANTYGGAYNSALLEEKTKEAARTYAAIKTAGDVALQHLLGGIPGLSGKASLGSVINNLSGKLNNAAFRAAAQLGGNAISEGAEEALQTYVEAGLRNLVFDEAFNLRDVSEDALYNSILGAASAAVFNAPNAAWEYMAQASDTSGKAVSGARITDPESDEANLFAESYYEEVRHYTTDAQKVSENMGISYEDALRIKNYLFVDNSKYNDETGVWEPFDADCAIAHSWQRLMLGRDIKPHDRTLILHELYEMELKKKYKWLSHDDAHEMASKKYDYAKESKRYYDNLKKHKKRG